VPRKGEEQKPTALNQYMATRAKTGRIGKSIFDFPYEFTKVEQVNPTPITVGRAAKMVTSNLSMKIKPPQFPKKKRRIQ
jgi:hypothetical protein